MSSAVMPQVGDNAPEFTLKSGDNEEVSLKDFRGQKVILYFYPKDDTPGCSAEACSFRDVNSEIAAEGAQVLGISALGVESKKAFAEKYNLNFPLLADEDRTVAQVYGTLRERTINGETVLGISRTTFAIDEDGKIAKIWEVSDSGSHGVEVLNWLKSQNG